MSHYTHLNLSPVTQITTQLTFRTIAFIAGAVQQLMPAAACYSVKSCLSLLLIYFLELLCCSNYLNVKLLLTIHIM